MTPGIANGFDYRRWLAFGSGIGIEIRGADLEIAAVRVRPSGAEMAGRTTVRRFRERPAAEWGAEYLEFVKRVGEGRLSAVVLLPRAEVIVRHLLLPGVAARDLDAAVAYQVDTLHPYGEDEVISGWSPLGRGAVLVGILRRQLTDRYVEMFAEAGVPVACFTFSAAVVHGALRLLGTPPESGFVAVSAAPGGPVEVYGESAARPVLSAEFDASVERAAMLGASELRLPPGTQPVPLHEILPQPRGRDGGLRPEDALVYAAALAGACPRLVRAANLLPAALRHANRRAVFVPTAILAALLIATGIAALAYNKLADRGYLRRLDAEIARLEPLARKAASLDRQIELARRRTRLLDEFQRRTRGDLDALNELTRLLPPPIWTNGIDLLRDAANISGEAERAAGLIKVIDESRCFQNSEPSVLARVGSNELFRIRTARREGCK